ncbi:MAG TPA: HEAT repeat domain-containing protein, partial [Leptospiraceae bacterium]|nr:HEAT repeat domain-containing protein [Leptospiraceae bacterium]
MPKWNQKARKWAHNVSFSASRFFSILALALPLAFALKAETTSEKEKPDRVEVMRLKILHSSSTERRNEIRKYKTLKPEEKAKLLPVLMKICTEDMDPQVRETTLRILSEEKEKKAEAAFLQALKDKQEDVQLAGISGLREIESKAAGEPIYALMKTLDPKKDVTRYTSAVRALGALEYRTDMPALIKLADGSDTHEEVRRAIVLYFGDVKAAEGKEYLVKLLKNEEKEPDLRAYAANSLGRMKDSSAVPVLKEVL